MHNSIFFDKSLNLSGVYYHSFHLVNFVYGDFGSKVIIDDGDIFPQRVRTELGSSIGYDRKNIYRLCGDISKGEVLYSSAKGIEFISGFSSSVFLDKKNREFICLDEQGCIIKRIKASNYFLPKACYYNDCFYEFMESEIVVTHLDDSLDKCPLPDSLGDFGDVYCFESGVYLEFYKSGFYNIYKFDYDKHDLVKVFSSKYMISKLTSFRGKEYFLSGGSLYIIVSGEVTKVGSDIGDDFLLTDNGLFFYKKYHNKISYIDSDNGFYSVSLPLGFFVASIIPSYGNLSAIQITTALGYEAFGIIPIYNLYINDMKDFFSLSNISLIEETDELITEEKEADRGTLIRLDIGFMDVFTAAQVVAGLTFSAFYKYCYRSDLAGANFPPESDKEIEGLFLYSIHKDFSECDRKLLISIVEEIFSYYLSNNIVYLENKNLRFEFE